MGTTSWDSCGVPIGLSKTHDRSYMTDIIIYRLLFTVRDSATLIFDKQSDFIALSTVFRLLTVVFSYLKNKIYLKFQYKIRLFLHLVGTITYGKGDKSSRPTSV